MYTELWSMSSSNLQLGDRLGVPPPSTEPEILQIVESGLAPAVISRLSNKGLERSPQLAYQDLTAIRLQLSTLGRIAQYNGLVLSEQFVVLIRRGRADADGE